VVAIPARSWRPFALPAVFLAAATLVVVGIRVLRPHHTPAATTPGATTPATHHQAHQKAPAQARYYRVRAGDTLGAIAERTKTPIARLHRLNPHVQPTALFIGQRLRLR
jgi:LysM repeat protein